MSVEQRHNCSILTAHDWLQFLTLTGKKGGLIMLSSTPCYRRLWHHPNDRVKALLLCHYGTLACYLKNKKNKKLSPFSVIKSALFWTTAEIHDATCVAVNSL